MPREKKKAAAPAADDATKPVDLQAVKDEIVAKAKKDGKVDQRDITAAIADTADNADILDGLYTELADAGVEVTAVAAAADDDMPASALAEDAMSDEWNLEDGEEIVAEDQHYLDDIADDSVRLYLREIGKIPTALPPRKN